MLDHEQMADALTATGNYRVLRRLVPRTAINEPDGSEVRHGIVLDTETTGLDPLKDEIIELAMVPFTYAPDGRIFEVREAFTGLREPSIPITAEITEITGIDAAMVAGRTIDPDQVAEFAGQCAVIIAHNAAFDRPFFERFCPAAAGKCWSCSLSEIDWRAEGFESLKLSTLLADIGLFYDRHRAGNDCLAVVELLSRPLPKSGVLALAALFATARKPTWRVWAPGSPFEAKDVLKARGYRWSPGDDNQPKSWYVDVREIEAREAEIAFLRTEIFKREGFDFPIDKITAFQRFGVPS